ncbi:MAG: hypothetical protein ABSF56_01920 [Minisyncoccia bacterium]|jgi:hypothetical protein
MAVKEKIVYVTRDIERALGMAPNEDYLIVTNRTPYGEKIRDEYRDSVILVEPDHGDLLGTADLLRHEKAAAALAVPNSYLLIFKNTARIEPIIREHAWRLLNPPAMTAEKIENKISQVSWLAELEHCLPSHRIQFMKSVAWNGEPFVVQWAHGHTGAGTILVNSEAELNSLKEKFPERRSRITAYVKGPSFTVNAVVTPDGVYAASPSYQITGLPPFTDGPFATVGNDWALAKAILSAEDMQLIKDLVRDLGAKMQKEYWRGLFGIDLIKDAASGKLFLVEVNARQPASVTFESALQEEARRTKSAEGLTTFEAHIAALLGQPLTKPIIEVTDGAQIVQRVTKTVKSVPEDAAGSLELAGYNVVTYPNTEENADLIRIQSTEGIMEKHGEFNGSGKEIMDALKQDVA